MNRASLSLALVSCSLLTASACTTARSHSGDGAGGGESSSTGGSASTGTGGANAGSGGAAGQSATGGTSGSAGGSTGAGGATSAIWKCPSPPSAYTALANTTSLAAPQRLTGVPPADNYGQGFSIIEGPVWLGDSLYVSQILGTSPPPPSRMLKIVPGNPATVFATDDGTNGLAILPDGDLVGAIHKDGSVCRIPLATPNSPQVIAGLYMGQRFNSPNDLAVRSDGNIYFSDPTYQAPSPFPQAKTRVYRVSPLPAAVVSVVDDTLSNPNGVTLSLDENTLYVSGPGLYKYPVLADGSVGAQQPAVTNPPMYSGSDGMVFDCAGDLYVASNATIAVINPAGTEVGRIMVSGVQAVSNVAFGGADHKTLFITTLDSNPGVFTIAMPLPGMPY